MTAATEWTLHSGIYTGGPRPASSRFYSGAGTPDNVEGDVGWQYFDTTGNDLYVCTTAGAAGSATWEICFTA